MNYFYEALDSTGNTVVGQIDAVDIGDVQQKLLWQGYQAKSIAQNTGALIAPVVAPIQQQLAPLSQGYAPPPVQLNSDSPQALRVKIQGAAVATRPRQLSVQAATPRHVPTATPVSSLAGVSTRDLQFFFEQATSLIKSGQTPYSAIENLSLRTPNKNLVQTLREMHQAAQNGKPVSEIMELYPRIYPEPVTGLIRAGELGGFLEIAFGEVATGFEQNVALYRASWIPKLMATQGVFMLAIGIPALPCIFVAAFDPAIFLPLYFKWLFFCSLPIAFALFFGIKLAARWINLPKNRLRRDAYALRMPPFGDLQRQRALATFSRVLSRLTKAGVAPIAAWEGATSTASNHAIREKLQTANQLMRQGSSLPDAFTSTGLFDNQMENLILTGQQSGEVVESLDQISSFYEQGAEVATKKSMFMMLRMGVLAMLVLGGTMVCFLAYQYTHGIFDFVDKFFKVD